MRKAASGNQGASTSLRQFFPGQGAGTRTDPPSAEASSPAGSSTCNPGCLALEVITSGPAQRHLDLGTPARPSGDLHRYPAGDRRKAAVVLAHCGVRQVVWFPC